MKETDIRPADLFDQYLALCEEDISDLFADQSEFIEIHCPCCGPAEHQFAFDKSGMAYVTCSKCDSLFLSPRPSKAQIEQYYRKSKGAKFWASTFYRATEEARRKALFRPRARLVAKLHERYGQGTTGTFTDVGAGYGIFLEEIAKLDRFNRVVGIEPGAAMAKSCRVKGFEVVEKAVEQVGPGELPTSFAAAFEVLEHVFDPQEFLRAVAGILEPGGLFLMTTLTVTGFDIQVLWERSNSVHPPAHINLLSVRGIEKLFKLSGFEVLELSTPGKLDVDIVRNMVGRHPEIELPRFVQTILRGPEPPRRSFQNFLRRNRLSSHIRVVARALS